MNCRIASRVIDVCGVRLPQCFEAFATGEAPEWHLLFGQNVSIGGRLLHEFTLGDGITRCTFLRDGDSYCFTVGDTLGMRYDGTDTVLSCGSCAPGCLPFAIWMAFALLAAGADAVPVHSSTIVHDGRAVMFLGESGTGKSTHTGLWLRHIPGTRLLNDDSPILAVEDCAPVVYGSPWSGKTGCYRNERHPVAAIVRLRQSPVNAITRLDTVGAFAALFPSCPPAFAADADLTDKIVGVISSVISRVPVYILDCLPDETAVRLCRETVLVQ